jgi:hypothetical protein
VYLVIIRVYDSMSVYHFACKLPSLSVNDVNIYQFPDSNDLNEPFVEINSVSGSSKYYIQNASSSSWPLAASGSCDSDCLRNFFTNLRRFLILCSLAVLFHLFIYLFIFFYSW